MKCKECKEIIPDNRKYCPECGALLNNIKYDIYGTNNYNPVQKKSNYEIRPQYTAPKTAKREAKKPHVLIIIAICIVISITAFSYSLLKTSDSEDYFFEDVITVNEYEDRAIEYVQNFFDSESGQNYFDFNYDTTIDWDYLCADLPVFSGIENFDDNLNEYFKVFCQNDINGVYSENTEIEHIEYSIISSNLLSEYELDTYVDILNSKLSPYGLTAEDYFDYDGIENLYEVQIAVSGINSDNNSVVDGFYTMIIAESYGFYDVLYDDYYIEKLSCSNNI